MENPIKLIHKFNKEAGLIDQGYSDFLESSYQIEEALEGFSNLPHLAMQVMIEDSVTGYSTYTPKDISRGIVGLATYNEGEPIEPLSDVDRLDKACDAVVFAVGSMAKLGLNAQEITKALNIVMHANFAKLKCPKDEFGKLTKPDDFVGPEPELQKILDKLGTK